jgi:hypothetical protein
VLGTKNSQQEHAHVPKMCALKHVCILGMCMCSCWAWMSDNHKDFKSQECVCALNAMDITFIIDQTYL